jgi:type I restriction enzyme, R subunit
MLEDIRKKLRNLVKFIDKQQRRVIYANFEDEIGELPEFPAPFGSAVNIVQYRKKVMNFLKENENNLALQKLRRNIPITKSDIAKLERMLFESGGMGTREDFEKVHGKQEQLAYLLGDWSASTEKLRKRHLGNI